MKTLFLLIALSISGVAFSKQPDQRLRAYDGQGRRDPVRDLVIRHGNIYQSDRQGRVLYEKGYIRLKDGQEFDKEGRRAGRRLDLSK